MFVGLCITQYGLIAHGSRHEYGLAGGMFLLGWHHKGCCGTALKHHLALGGSQGTKMNS